MTEMAPVSVVIPCWRCADTIGRAVASIAAQTLLPLEVILVDDASGDDTYSTLCDLADAYDPHWIKVLALEKNGGVGWARNAGWELSTSPYIAFLDADDAWFPQKLERQMEWMLAHPETTMTGHRTILWKEGDEIPLVPSDIPVKQVSLPSMLISNRFPARSVILRRDVPFRFGGRECTEDYGLWLDLVAFGADCRVMDAVLACCFRAEASPGGYSGQLWRHECRELVTLESMRGKGQISTWLWALSSLWSLTKYLRRVIRRHYFE